MRASSVRDVRAPLKQKSGPQAHSGTLLEVATHKYSTRGRLVPPRLAAVPRRRDAGTSATRWSVTRPDRGRDQVVAARADDHAPESCPAR